ncbi:MAG TPA: TRAP transporter small permease [Burkholderiales bacterium]|nr:TRAP transporter small permease [Burkholderiales bacterium]
MIERLSEAHGKLLSALALVACALLFLMTLMICGDVLLRNTAIVPGVRNIAWSNEVSEATLYLVTMLTAPWLLRQGRHIRVDVVLRILPKKLGWYCEWASDVLAFACCVAMAAYGASATLASWKAGSMSVKTLVMPEWWLLAPLPVAFLLLAIEMLFRMRRLHLGERAPRDDAVSAG